MPPRKKYSKKRSTKRRVFKRKRSTKRSTSVKRRRTSTVRKKRAKSAHQVCRIPTFVYPKNADQGTQTLVFSNHQRLGWTPSAPTLIGTYFPIGPIGQTFGSGPYQDIWQKPFGTSAINTVNTIDVNLGARTAGQRFINYYIDSYTISITVRRQDAALADLSIGMCPLNVNQFLSLVQPATTLEPNADAIGGFRP